MPSLNNVLLMGNLTKDPEVKYIPSGKAVGDLRLAVNRKYRTGSGEDKDETCFVNIVVWGRQAETCGEYLKKGSSVFIEGRLQYDEWEKDGQRQNRLRVVANRVQFMGSPGGGSRRSEPSEPSESVGATAVPPVVDSAPPPVDNVGDDDNVPF